MFRNIKFITYDYDYDNVPGIDDHLPYIVSYMIYDSDFTCVTKVKMGAAAFDVGAGSMCEIAIIQEYQKRNLNVARNLALYYKYCRFIDLNFYKEHNKKTYFIIDWIDRHFPELQYGSKIHPCMINQLSMLNFGKTNE